MSIINVGAFYVIINQALMREPCDMKKHTLIMKIVTIINLTTMFVRLPFPDHWRGSERWPSPARRVLLVNVLIGRSDSAVAGQVHGHVGRAKKR